MVNVQATESDNTVSQIVAAMEGAYLRDPQHSFFIVVSHSQGNFFSEAIAYRLEHGGSNDAQIFSTRLGIVSLGSPTNFASLQAPDFVANKIVHHTRADDAINIVATLARVGGVKVPWQANDPSLWPWPASSTFDGALNLLPGYNWDPARGPFGLDQLRPPSGDYDPRHAIFWQRMGYDPGSSVLNPELYQPMLNSHLLDNYLDSPTATASGIYLRPDPNLVPWVISPKTTPVLNCIRHDLLQLKKNLLHPATSVSATRTCSSRG